MSDEPVSDPQTQAPETAAPPKSKAGFLLLGMLAAAVLLGLVVWQNAGNDPHSGDAHTGAEGSSGDDGVHLVIESEPSGATVILNGHIAGATPLTIEAPQKGVYGLRLEKFGHAPLYEQLVVTGKPMTVHKVLPDIDVGLVKVDIEPLGAEVLLNGELMGHTPLELPATPSGSYELTIRKTNFEPYKQRFILQPGKTMEFSGIELKDRILELMEGYCRAEPQRVAHWIDIAHYHFINSRMDESVDAFMKAQEVAEQPLEFDARITPDERGLEQRLRNEDRDRLGKELRKHKSWPGKHTREFREKLERAHEIYSQRNIGSWNWVDLAANNFMKQHNLARAEQLYAQHLQAVPNGKSTLNCCLALLKIRLKQSNVSTAARTFNQLYELAQDKPELLLDAARLLLGYKDMVRINAREELLDMAEKAVRRALDQTNNEVIKAECAKELGDVLTAQKHPGEAVAYYEQAVAAAPNAEKKENWELRLAEALRQSRRYVEAERLYDHLTRSKNVLVREKAKAGQILVKMARQDNATPQPR